MADFITEKHCQKIISKLNSNFILESYDIKPLVEESLGGLIGQYFNLYIHYKDGDQKQNVQLFVKTLDKDSPTMYRISKNLLFYEKEKLILETLLPAYEEKGLDVNFSPRGYLCENETVVMEDLSLSGFKLTPKDKPLDLSHCRSCLKTLAKFHVSSILYEICKSKSLAVPYSLHDEYPELLKDFLHPGGDGDGSKHIDQSLKGVVALAELEFVDDIDMKKFQRELFSKKVWDQPDTSKMRSTLLHGDLWSNNFLHKYENGLLAETKLIDFQLIKYGPPGLDVIQFIFTNTRKAFRDEYLDNLIMYYYQTLDELLHERSLYIGDILPKDEFLRSCESFKVFAKIYTVIDRCMTCLPDEAYLITMASDEVFYDYVFENRAKFLTEIYNTVPKFREIIQEDLRELKEMLCNS